LTFRVSGFGLRASLLTPTPVYFSEFSPGGNEVDCINKVALCHAQLVLGLVTISMCNQIPIPTQRPNLSGSGNKYQLMHGEWWCCVAAENRGIAHSICRCTCGWQINCVIPTGVGLLGLDLNCFTEFLDECNTMRYCFTNLLLKFFSLCGPLCSLATNCWYLVSIFCRN